jgi:metallophosphoesterase superfamily enzyme
MAKNEIVICIPDSHGTHVNRAARDAVLRDLRRVKPARIVMLGDHLDCGGVFSSHQRTYTNEMVESYENDYTATNRFLDAIQKASPDSRIDYLEGNHEQHVERWAARNFERRRDAESLLSVWGPAAVLRLKERDIRYYKRSEHYQGISIQGTIKIGNCYYTHGIVANRYSTATHLARFGSNVVHGHSHTAQEFRSRTVRSAMIGAWCPGTLAELQALYMHTNPSTWNHGYGFQLHSKSGAFLHWNVPIVDGRSLLGATIDALAA